MARWILEGCRVGGGLGLGWVHVGFRVGWYKTHFKAATAPYSQRKFACTIQLICLHCTVAASLIPIKFKTVGRHIDIHPKHRLKIVDDAQAFTTRPQGHQNPGFGTRGTSAWLSLSGAPAELHFPWRPEAPAKRLYLKEALPIPLCLE